jgi:Tol biopolymer transport system component
MGDYQPTWSPDGTRIAFSRLDFNDLRAEIFSLSLDGGEARQLTNSGEYLVDADWSPDGTRIVFWSNLGEDIWTIDSELGHPEFGYPPGSFVHWGEKPAWSPDGTMITFAGVPDDDNLYTTNLGGTGETQLLPGTDPSWQPLPGPVRTDYKNGAHFCKAERDFLGDESFTGRHGGGANAFGQCVSASH